MLKIVLQIRLALLQETHDLHGLPTQLDAPEVLLLARCILPPRSYLTDLESMLQLEGPLQHVWLSGS